jgi:large subunit ribosomal protein L17
MKHGNSIRKFGRVARQRKALVRSLAESLIIHGRIQTTEAKAKELRPVVEKMITMANKGTLASRRLLTARLGEIGTTKLVKEVAPKYKERNGGYTRITHTGIRKGDASRQAVIEFV